MEDISWQYCLGAFVDKEYERKMFWERKKLRKKMIKKFGRKNAKLMWYLAYKTRESVYKYIDEALTLGVERKNNERNK